MTLALDAPHVDLDREEDPRGAAPRGPVHPFPYSNLIGRLIEKDYVKAARRLLQVASRQTPSDPRLAHWQLVLSPPVVRKSPLLDVDRDLDYRWLDEHSKDYSGQWVALLFGELVAHAPSLKEILAILNASPPAARPLAVRID
jgi:hypothetical protein